MARKTDLAVLKSKSLRDIFHLEQRFLSFETRMSSHYLLMRWVASMSVVELHSIWERFAEIRLIIALNHNPQFFISENAIKGVEGISRGLAHVVIKGNNKYFDFRNSAELIDKGNKLLGSSNPFLSLKENNKGKYLDAISAIRNCVAHRSAVSDKAYKRELKNSFGITKAPEPDEFLYAIDNRKNSAYKGKKRFFVLLEIVRNIIQTL